MKPSIITIAISIFLASHCGYVSATDSPDERQKRHVVSRLYEITESMVQQCSHAPSSVANKYKLEVSRFVEANPKLMTLVKQSPHYEYAQKNYAYERRNDPHTVEMLVSVCGYFSDAIGAMIDTPQGKSEVDKLEKILSQ